MSSPVRVVVAPDSFKECCSASEAARAMADGVREGWPEVEVLELPMGDGGEGTLDVLARGAGAQRVRGATISQLGEGVDAEVLYWPARQAAYVESAMACGLALVPAARRDVQRGNTRGVGKLIRRALELGVRELTIGIGGSGTVDGGTGLARELGWRFLDADGRELPEGPGALGDLARIEAPTARPWANVRVRVAADVTNPLTGPQGAARVYGPQKGASPADVEVLEAGLARLAAVWEAQYGTDVGVRPGAGAAGGMGAGLMAFMGAEMVSGIELAIELSGLQEALHGAAFVLTGEGRTDGQTAAGKVAAGVAAAARTAGVPCMLIAGSVTATAAELRALGIAGAFSLCRGPQPLATAVAEWEWQLRETAAAIAGIWHCRQGD